MILKLRLSKIDNSTWKDVERLFKKQLQDLAMSKSGPLNVKEVKRLVHLVLKSFGLKGSLEYLRELMKLARNMLDIGL